MAATSIEEAGIFSNTTFGPTPATDVLRISTGLPLGTLASCALTDALGRAVRTGTLNGAGIITVHELTPGTYHMTLRAANGVKSFSVQVK